MQFFDSRPLEDAASDVLGKAVRAYLHPKYLSHGIHENPTDSDLDSLGLNAAAFHAIGAYRPNLSLPGKIRCLEFPLYFGTVNVWLIRTEKLSFIIDSGTSNSNIVAALRFYGIKSVSAVLVTHSHHDHVGGLARLATEFPKTRIIGPKGVNGITEKITHNKGLLLNEYFALTTVDLAGHCDGALGYIFYIGEQMFCAVGDAVFAGSVGGMAHADYSKGLKNIEKLVGSLPPETILLPGHGPATTVALEKMHNPFIANWFL